ncbi:histidine phosphatase family protein [Salinicoccus halodurans]|uniref:Broad-specificity phosphatase PhoE n=1 Tax=Salinicoccus halodurans TaxID=407035 RepID=A0A0F7HLQ4_9STAP|nr:histidine phosphatase family protein [Salinicoccus halodurans]AKG74274.1 hypothetical protein AAT16_08545 [Salinicoccus halodurans]SFK93866.1 broad-specificity phosphatase PhoE [Salinicoccus halodurans]
MTKICLVRHGLTDFNAQRKLQGSSDIPLNAEGESQAESAREKLKDYHFDAIISSPLIRAYRTAEIINESHGLEIETMDELKEQSFGPLEGNHIDDIQEKYPDGIFPGAESFESLSNRVAAAIREIENKYPDKHILLTAHSRTIKSILALYSDEIHMFETKLDNCSLSHIECIDSKWTVNDFNITTQPAVDR